MAWEKKSVWITGGSRGLGRALAERLAREGARLALVARGRPELDATVGAIRAAGGEAHGIAEDLGSPGAAARIAARASLAVGTPDLLVLGASSLGPLPMPGLADLAPEELEAVYRVNLLGPFALLKACLGPMVLAGRGTVLAISSDAAVQAYPGWGAYGSSKAAFDHLVRTLAAEIAGRGLTFLAADPGEMDTAMHRDAMPDADPTRLARPDGVAARLLEALAAPDAYPSGTRFEAARVRTLLRTPAAGGAR